MNADTKKRYKDITFPFTCPISNREFNSSRGLSCYVTKTIKINHEDYYNKYINHRDFSCFFCGNKGKFISISKGYRNLCDNKDCLKKSFSSHSVEGFMYRNFSSREEAEVLFNKENDRQLIERTKSQNKLRGQDPLWDKKRSRNCKEFWINKGLSEEDAAIKSSEAMDDIHKKTSIKLKGDPIKYASKYPTKIEYYLKRGNTDQEAREKISEIQNRFSLKLCIDKYGEEEGTKIWKDRQEKWIATLNSKPEEEKIEINRKKLSGAYVSPISQKLFWEIYNLIGGKVKFGELGGEFHLLNDQKNWYAYDYVDISRKKCIEFNGDFWHCHPSSFNAEDIHRVKNKKAKDIWENDRIKKELMESKGYDVLIIWDSEYRRDTKSTLNKCIKFLEGK
jgi:hypothetical protein